MASAATIDTLGFQQAFLSATSKDEFETHKLTDDQGLTLLAETFQDSLRPDQPPLEIKTNEDGHKFHFYTLRRTPGITPKIQPTKEKTLVVFTDIQAVSRQIAARIKRTGCLLTLGSIRSVSRRGMSGPVNEYVYQCFNLPLNPSLRQPVSKDPSLFSFQGHFNPYAAYIKEKGIDGKSCLIEQMVSSDYAADAVCARLNQHRSLQVTTVAERAFADMSEGGHTIIYELPASTLQSRVATILQDNSNITTTQTTDKHGNPVTDYRCTS